MLCYLPPQTVEFFNILRQGIGFDGVSQSMHKLLVIIEIMDGIKACAEDFAGLVQMT